jgi:ATP-binding cassette, subfamily B, bacterial
VLSELKQKLWQALYLAPVLRLIWQSSPYWTIGRVVLLTIQGILPLISLYLTKLLIDQIELNIGVTNQSQTTVSILLLFSLIGLVTTLNTFCDATSEWINTAQVEKLTNHMQSILHAKSIEVDLAYYEDSHYYDTLQRAQREAPYRPAEILSHLVQVGQNSIFLFTMVGLLLSLHWSVVSVLVISAIPVVLVRLKQSQSLFHWQRRWTASERRASYLSWLLTESLFAKEIRLFNLGQYLSQQFDRLRQQLYHTKLKLISQQMFLLFVTQTFAEVLVFAVYGFVIYQTLRGVLTLGDLVLYYQALQRGQTSLSAVMGGVANLYEDNLFIANLYEFLELKTQIVTPASPKAIPQPLHQGVVFERVCFRYANSTHDVLQDISLTVRPGETIALVGENGSGKTTLVKLLCRLYDPMSGAITIDGINLQDFDVTQLRQQISVIFQDYARYHFTAQENIGVGDIQFLESQRIVEAAQRSGADQVITRLPQGYNTVLGTLFEQGEELSIGQWQKVALARAFLRDAQIIVLDEPTSSMDAKAEHEVFQKFRQLIHNQIAILITHRLATARLADYIYVMERGRIVESGTHEELVQRNGTYAHLFELQAKNYHSITTSTFNIQ